MSAEEYKDLARASLKQGLQEADKSAKTHVEDTLCLMGIGYALLGILEHLQAVEARESDQSRTQEERDSLAESVAIYGTGGM